MASRLSIFEEFLTLFECVVTAAKDSPERLVNFHDQSQEISETANALQRFLWETDFERRVFHGPKKILARTPSNFEARWKDYNCRWAPALSHIFLRGLFPEGTWEFKPGTVVVRSEPVAPDPESDEDFDPRLHDGGAALELGIERLDVESEFALDEATGNSCRLALGAYDYLTETIGLNVRDVFHRWHKVPVVFMPAHVSNRYGASDKGSLLHLLDDAVRAYVFGAPAAAIAMCRAALETVLKRHYGHGEWERAGLEKVVSLASKRHEFISESTITPLVRQSNRILHDYEKADRLSAEDDRTILIFLATVKSLIERAPSP